MSGADIRKFTFLKGLKIDEFEGFGVQGEVHQIPRGEIGLLTGLQYQQVRPTLML